MQIFDKLLCSCLPKTMIGLFDRFSAGGSIYSSCAPSTGFNPRWDCTVSFQLQVPELTLVRFVVEDHDHTSKNDFVGQFTLPFTSLRTGAHQYSTCYKTVITAASFVWGLCFVLFSGYRHVHLLKADGSSLSPATLFIHVKVSRKGVPIKTVSERIAFAKAKAWRVSEPDWKLRFLRTKSFGKRALNVRNEREELMLLLTASLPVQKRLNLH